MATCKNCGRPLIVSEGKCVYCGFSAQSTSGSTVKSGGKTSWVSKAKTTLSSKTKTWAQTFMKKGIISIIAAIILGILVLVCRPWPGCIISISMLVLVISLVVLCFQAVEIDQGDDSDEEKKPRQVKLNLMLNVLLIWGGCFLIVGIVCMFISWWAVLLAELIGIGLLFFAWMRSKELLR